MTMTFNEVAELLAFCATHDRRIGDELDVKAWLMIANDQRWTAETALRVAVEHYGQGADRPRLEAPAITDRIRAIRKKAADTFELPRIPDHVSNAEYPRWLRAQRDRHVDALLHRWATSGEEPPTQLPTGPPPSEIGRRRLAELTAGAFRNVSAAALPSGQPPTAEGVQERRDAFSRPCPYCSARPGEPCTRSGANGRVRIQHPHPARTESRSEEAS